MSITLLKGWICYENWNSFPKEITSQSNHIINAWLKGGRQQPIATANRTSMFTLAVWLLSFLLCHFPSLWCWGCSALLLCLQASGPHSQAPHNKMMKRLSSGYGLTVWCFLLHSFTLPPCYSSSVGNTKPIFSSGKWPGHFPLCGKNKHRRWL